MAEHCVRVAGMLVQIQLARPPLDVAQSAERVAWAHEASTVPAVGPGETAQCAVERRAGERLVRELVAGSSPAGPTISYLDVSGSGQHAGLWRRRHEFDSRTSNQFYEGCAPTACGLPPRTLS